MQEYVAEGGRARLSQCANVGGWCQVDYERSLPLSLIAKSIYAPQTGRGSQEKGNTNTNKDTNTVTNIVTDYK